MDREDRLIIVSFVPEGESLMTKDCSKPILRKDCCGFFAAMDLSGQFFYSEIGDVSASTDKLIIFNNKNNNKDTIMNFVNSFGDPIESGGHWSVGKGTIERVSVQFDEWLYATKANRNNIIFLGNPRSMCVAASMCTYENDFIMSHYMSDHARVKNSGNPLKYVKYCRDEIRKGGLNTFTNAKRYGYGGYV